MAGWTDYREGMGIIGERCRVIGLAHQYNFWVSLYDGKNVTLPNGLVAFFNILVAGGIVIKFIITIALDCGLRFPLSCF